VIVLDEPTATAQSIGRRNCSKSFHNGDALIVPDGVAGLFRAGAALVRVSLAATRRGARLFDALPFGSRLNYNNS